MANGVFISVLLLAFFEVTSASTISSDSQMLTMIKEIQGKTSTQEKAMRSLQSHIAKQDSIINSLQSHIAKQDSIINSLQSHIAKQDIVISSLQSHTAEQGYEISSLKDQDKRQNNLINAFLKQWKLHGEPISDWSDINMEHTDAIQAKKVQISTQPYPNDTLRDQEQTPFKQEPIRPKRRSTEGTEPVAFQAVVSAHSVSHIGLHQKIVFDSVHLNIGGSYHNLLGVFIAPRAGIYLFATSILTDPSSGIEVNVMKNGIPLGGALCEGTTYDQGSVTVVVELHAADEVWIETVWPADTRLRGHGFHSSFTGVLVMGM